GRHEGFRTRRRRHDRSAPDRARFVPRAGQERHRARCRHAQAHGRGRQRWRERRGRERRARARAGAVARGRRSRPPAARARMRLARGRPPVLTLALAAVAAGLLFAPRWSAALEYRRERVLAGELWRAWSGHLVHATPRLAVLDLAVLVLLGA